MNPEASDAEPFSAFFEFLGQLLLVGGIIFMVSTALLGLATWLVVRKVRRTGVIRRLKDEASMTARTLSGDGSVRRLAKLRVELHRSIKATERSLAAAYSAGTPVGDLPAVAAELHRAHRSLEDNIRIAEQEPDRQLRVAHGTRFGKQVDKLTELSAQVRQSLLQLGDDVGNSAASSAGTRLKLELEGIQAWSSSYGTTPENRTTTA